MASAKIIMTADDANAIALALLKKNLEAKTNVRKGK